MTTEPTDDLQQRCAECIEWQQTGELRQGALRAYAEKHWHGHHDSLQMAERDTTEEAMRWIAKWGTPPAVAGEPVAWYEYARKKPSLRRLVFERTSRKDLRTAGWVAEPLYATPQPTQPQAGAVPLTVDEVEQLIAQWSYEVHGDRARYLVRMTEQHHGIKGGQHGAE